MPIIWSKAYKPYFIRTYLTPVDAEQMKQRANKQVENKYMQEKNLLK